MCEKARCNQPCEPMPLFRCDLQEGHGNRHSCSGDEGSIEWWSEGGRVVTAIEEGLYKAVFGKRPEVGDTLKPPKVH